MCLINKPAFCIKKTLFLVFVSALFVLPSVSLADDAQQVKDVRSAFENYRKAVLNDRGDKAAELVTQGTLDYYGEMKHVALTAPAREVKSLAAGEKFFVIRLRLAIPREQLTLLSAKELFSYSVKSGWIGKDGVRNMKLGKISVSDTFAAGEYSSRGKKSPIKFQFRKESETWKLDLLPLAKLSSELFDYLAKQQGLSQNEFVFRLLKKNCIDEKSQRRFGMRFITANGFSRLFSIVFISDHI